MATRVSDLRRPLAAPLMLMLASSLSAAALTSCAHGGGDSAAGGESLTSPASPASVAPPPSPAESTALSSTGAPRQAPSPAAAAPLPPETCLVLSRLPHDPPVVVPGQNVVLTRLMRPCVTRAGQRGFDQATPYLAMGFPCTGGSGRVDIKGHHVNPKLVSFLLGTDCAMAPASPAIVQSILQAAFALPPAAKLAAYTPFVVQYWEVPGMSDAGIGYAVELTSAPAVEGGWRRIQQAQPLRVNLYGRENSWAQGDNFYYVEADLKMTGHNSFQLQLVQVKPLSKDETSVVRARCEALRPKRDCTDVF